MNPLVFFMSMLLASVFYSVVHGDSPPVHKAKYKYAQVGDTVTLQCLAEIPDTETEGSGLIDEKDGSLGDDEDQILNKVPSRQQLVITWIKQVNGSICPNALISEGEMTFQSVTLEDAGVYLCIARFGDAVSIAATRLIIQDVDECKETPDICDGGRCENLPGSYRCQCTGGLTASPEQKRCLDVNECLLKKNLCMHGQCHNTHGSFVCKCDVGFSVKTQIRATGCTDDNECQIGISGCDENALCINTQGSFKCDCKPGYTGDGFNCRDVNECLMDPGLCENGQCYNFEGGYRCKCDDGFTPTTDERACMVCRDAFGTTFCEDYIDKFSSCSDIITGTVVCCDTCKKRKTEIPEIDPCLDGNGGCSQECINDQGQARCRCDTGFSLGRDGKTCEEIDPCLDGNGGCSQECINDRGQVRCRCNTGFVLGRDGKTCEEIDPCLDGNGGCSQECINDKGQARCRCNTGFSLGRDGKTCEVCKNHFSYCKNSPKCSDEIHRTTYCCEKCKERKTEISGCHGDRKVEVNIGYVTCQQLIDQFNIVSTCKKYKEECCRTCKDYNSA